MSPLRGSAPGAPKGRHPSARGVSPGTFIGDRAPGAPKGRHPSSRGVSPGILEAFLCTACLLTACTEPEPPPPADGLFDDLFILSDAVRAELAPVAPSSERAAPLLEDLVRRAREKTTGKAPEAAARALAGLLFDELGYRREIEDRSPRLMLLPYVLAERRGSCLGLSALYLSLAERVGLPARAVLVPDHLFVRVDAPQGHVNVELLRRGELMPDAWYPERFAVPAGVSAYLRPLSAAELLAVLRFNLANAYRERKRLAKACRLYQSVARAFPEFAEAQASLGLTLQLLGELDAADAAYRRAAELHPALPGLDQNRKALAKARRERL